MLYLVTADDLDQFPDADLKISLGRIQGTKRARQIEPSEGIWERWRQIQKALHAYLDSGQEWEPQWLGKYRQSLATKQRASIEVLLQAFGEQLRDPALVPGQFVQAYRQELEQDPSKRAALIQLLAQAADPTQQVVISASDDDAVFLIPVLEFARARRVTCRMGTHFKTQPYRLTQGQWVWRTQRHIN